MSSIRSKLKLDVLKKKQQVLSNTLNIPISNIVESKKKESTNKKSNKPKSNKPKIEENKAESNNNIEEIKQILNNVQTEHFFKTSITHYEQFFTYIFDSNIIFNLEDEE